MRPFAIYVPRKHSTTGNVLNGLTFGVDASAARPAGVNNNKTRRSSFFTGEEKKAGRDGDVLSCEGGSLRPVEIFKAFGEPAASLRNYGCLLTRVLHSKLRPRRSPLFQKVHSYFTIKPGQELSLAQVLGQLATFLLFGRRFFGRKRSCTFGDESGKTSCEKWFSYPSLLRPPLPHRRNIY